MDLQKQNMNLNDLQKREQKNHTIQKEHINLHDKNGIHEKKLFDDYIKQLNNKLMFGNLEINI